MLLWNTYFISKLALHILDMLKLEVSANIVLFIIMLASLSLARRHARWLIPVLHIGFIGPALALALHELGLVVSWALLGQIQQMLGFSFQYLIELAQRSIPAWMIWSLLGLALSLKILDRYLRTPVWVFTALCALGIASVVHSNFNQAPETLANHTETLALARENLSPAERLALGHLDYQRLVSVRQHSALSNKSESNSGPEQTLEEFFNEQMSVVPTPLSEVPQAPNFDVIVLQVCSLAWSDMQAVRQTQHPLVRGADFIFENFNTATSYSGPAAMRLLRANCGQTSHQKLYETVHDDCLLFQQLREAGFHIEMGLNHDGRFDDFMGLVKRNIGDPYRQPVLNTEVPLGVISFDGSSIGRDGDFLRTWWNKRLNSSKDAVAYYYNTITLHDGNRMPNSDARSLDTYGLRLERLFNDVMSLIGEIRRSERQAMVLIVPEHGAGLSGEFGQLVGLRELPTPAITRVPVLGYWVSPNKTLQSQAAEPVVVKTPVSYRALTTLLNRWMLQTDAERKLAQWTILTQDLPSTQFVAQQGNITVLEAKNEYWLKAPGVNWRSIGVVASSQPGPMNSNPGGILFAPKAQTMPTSPEPTQNRPANSSSLKP